MAISSHSSVLLITLDINHCWCAVDAYNSALWRLLCSANKKGAHAAANV
jgi:hypothetical protein